MRAASTHATRSARAGVHAKSAPSIARAPQRQPSPTGQLLPGGPQSAAELKAVDGYESTHSFDTAGASPDYAAIFSRTAWNLTIYTSNYSKRSGVTKVGDLTVDEAANLASHVFHELRHAEQYFRIARVLAAESTKTTTADIAKEIVAKTSIKADVALAAAAKPLAATKATSGLVAEAKDWESITVGRHADYKANMLNWGNECDAARDVAAAVTTATLGATKTGLDTNITNWKGATRGPFVDTHITTIEAIKSKGKMDRLALSSLKKIKPLWAKVEASWTTVTSDWATDKDPARLTKIGATGALLRKLSKVLYAAYRDYLHEHDAFETGDAAGKRFRSLANKKKKK